MSDKEEDVCDFCESKCSQYESFEGENVQMCDICYDAMPIDEYSGQRVLEIVATVGTQYGNALEIGQETLDNEVTTCDWSDDLVFSDQLIEIGGGDAYVSYNYSDDVSYCEDCGYRYSNDNCTYHNGNGVT